MNERELFEKTITDKCGFNPKSSFELSEVTGDYKSDVIYFAWVMWQASANRQGYKLVPVEPTEKMLDAARRRQWDDLSSPFEDMDMLKYKAMIGAVDEST